jgi:hypothetical protein
VKGREYAYNYYGDKCGASRDEIASTLERCHHPSYQDRRDTHGAASSFDESRSSFQDFTIDNAISFKKVSAFSTFVSFPAENIKKLGDWSYSKAGSPYSGIYPNFLTSSSAPDLPVVPSRKSPSSQEGPTSSDLEENSDANTVASPSEIDTSQDSAEDGDSFDNPDGLAEEPLDRQLTEAASAANDNSQDDSQDGSDDDKEPAEAEDEEFSDSGLADEPEETDEVPSGLDSDSDDPSNASQEESDEQSTGNPELSRRVFDYVGNAASSVEDIASRGVLNAFDGINGAREGSGPIVSRGLLYAFEDAGDAKEALAPVGESAFAKRNTGDRDTKDDTIKWPSTTPGHDDHIGPNDDEGEE